MAMPYYTAIVTLLAVAFYFIVGTRVAVAHGKFNVKLPAPTDNLDIERIFRARWSVRSKVEVRSPRLHSPR
jgi:glutathione S-transferase